LSVRQNTNASGSGVGRQGHFPFGESWYSVNTTTKWQFTSYERDTESGNDYAIARYHMNRVGRFSSPDPLGGFEGNPQSFSLYSYVVNNPVNLLDPLGLKWAQTCYEGIGGRDCSWSWQPDASDACPIGGCDPPLDPDHPRHDPKEPPQKPANKAAPLILKAQSDCPTANGREIDYTLQDANGNPVSDYTVVEHQTDTSRASSAFGPGTSFETAPPGTGSGFQDTLNPGPYQKPGNSIQTFTVTTAKPSPSAPQQPVMIQSVNGQMNGSLGIWFQFPQVFVNGVPTPTQCVFGR